MSKAESDVEIVSYYESDDYYDGAKNYMIGLKGYIRNDNASVMDDTAEYNSGKYAVWVTYINRALRRIQKRH